MHSISDRLHVHQGNIMKYEDTPRTDEAEEESFRAHNNSLSARAAGWEYARELEREINEMTTKQIELVNHLKLYSANVEGHAPADK